MAYNTQIKADSEIFEKIRFISVDERYVLKPIMQEIIKDEANFYKVNSNDERIKKYLPSYYASDSQTAEKQLHDLIQRTIFKQSILYCIRDKNQPFPIGYINIISPLSPTGLNDWSIDFWMGKIAEGNGHMKASLIKLLEYMAQMNIENVKALVDIANIRSIKVLEKAGFSLLNTEIDGQRYLMSINLKNKIENGLNEIQTFFNKFKEFPRNIQIDLAEKTDQLTSIGCNYFENDDIENAIIFFKKALAIFPINDDALNNLFVCYQYLNDHNNMKDVQSKLEYIKKMGL